MVGKTDRTWRHLPDDLRLFVAIPQTERGNRRKAAALGKPTQGQQHKNKLHAAHSVRSQKYGGDSNHMARKFTE